MDGCGFSIDPYDWTHVVKYTLTSNHETKRNCSLQFDNITRSSADSYYGISFNQA